MDNEKTGTVDEAAESILADIGEDAEGQEEPEQLDADDQAEDAPEESDDSDEAAPGDDPEADEEKPAEEDAPVDEYEGYFADDPEPAESPVADDKLKEIQTERKTERVAELESQVTQLQQTIAQMGGMEPPSIDLIDPEHDDYDPTEYNRLNAAYQRNQIERQQQNEALQAKQFEEARVHIAQRDAILAKTNPELSDPEKGPRLQQAVRNIAIDIGVQPEAVPLLSAGAVTLILDAMKHRSGVKSLARAKAEKKVSTSKIRQSPRKGPNKASNAQEKFKRSGSVDDAAAWLMETTPE